MKIKAKDDSDKAGVQPRNINETWKISVVETEMKIIEGEHGPFMTKFESMVQGNGKNLSEALADLGRNRSITHEDTIKRHSARPTIAGVARWGA